MVPNNRFIATNSVKACIAVFASFGIADSYHHNQTENNLKGRPMSLVTQNFYHFDRDTAERLCRIETKLGTIIENLETFKMSFEDEIARAKAAQDATNAQLDGIKADVESLKAQIANFPAAGLTPEQEAALKEIADGAVALAAKAGAVNDMTP